MKGAPGSIGWLLRHELRLAWYNAASGKPKAAPRRPGTAGLVTAGVVWLVLHAVALFVVSRIGAIDAGDPRVLVAVSAILIGCMTFMLSTALKSSVLVLFERGDLDLLLSSPLGSHSIFTVRLGAVAISTATLYLFLLAPFAHAGALLGQLRWLAVYPVILGCATLIACIAMLMTLGLVRVLGARRPRVVAQVIGALAGALLFILSQLFSHFSQSMEAQAATAFARAFDSSGPLGAASPLWLPGRALLGEPLPVLGTVLAALAAFAFTAGRTHRFFMRGLQEAASSSRNAPRPAGGVRYRFGRSLFDTVVLKEWRLILRDPHLISQVALQLIYLLPLCFLVFRRKEIQLPAVAAGLTLLCGSLTASLAWIIVLAEDAPDLLRLAPAPPRTIRLAKLAAAAMPSLLIVVLPLLWLVVRAPAAGLLACFTVSGAVCSAALVAHWCGRPGARSDYMARGKGDLLRTLLETINSLSWAGLGWLLISATVKAPSGTEMTGMVVAFACTFLTLLAAWLLRRPQA
jgi:ABC-2 type transport system permease protein